MNSIPRRLRALQSAAILAHGVSRALSELDPDSQEDLILKTLEFAESVLERHRWRFNAPEPAPVSPSKLHSELPF